MKTQQGTENEYLTDADLDDFLKLKLDLFQPWYKDSNVKDEDMDALFRELIDDWFRWFYASSKKLGVADNTDGTITTEGVNFINPTPFQKPYVKRITLEGEQSLLVPVYSASASEREYGECDLQQAVVNDLLGIDEKNFEVKLDGEKFVGGSVKLDARKFDSKDLTLDGEKSVGTCIITQTTFPEAGKISYGGLWLLLNAKDLGRGDHLLSFRAYSKNYEVDAKIHIHVLK